MRQCIWNPTEQPQFHKLPSPLAASARCVCERTERWVSSLMPGTSKSRNFSETLYVLTVGILFLYPPTEKNFPQDPGLPGRRGSRILTGRVPAAFHFSSCQHVTQLTASTLCTLGARLCTFDTQSLKLNDQKKTNLLRHKGSYFSAFSTWLRSTIIIYY